MISAWHLLWIVPIVAGFGISAGLRLNRAKIDILELQLKNNLSDFCSTCLWPDKLEKSRERCRELEAQLLTEQRSNSQIIGQNKRLWNLCPNDLRKRA